MHCFGDFLHLPLLPHLRKVCYCLTHFEREVRLMWEEEWRDGLTRVDAGVIAGSSTSLGALPFRPSQGVEGWTQRGTGHFANDFHAFLGDSTVKQWRMSRYDDKLARNNHYGRFIMLFFMGISHFFSVNTTCDWAHTPSAILYNVFC
jgi:hypothetical protein